MKATRRQIAKMWVLAKRWGWSSESLHSFVRSVTGKEHISQLTSREAGRVLDEMEYFFAPRPGKLSGAQRAKILAIMYRIGWDRRRLNGLCRKMFGLDNWEWMSHEQAWRFIEALKGFEERQVGRYEPEEERLPF